MWTEAKVSSARPGPLKRPTHLKVVRVIIPLLTLDTLALCILPHHDLLLNLLLLRPAQSHTLAEPVLDDALQLVEGLVGVGELGTKGSDDV